MSKTPILHPFKRHPLTGRRLEALGILPNGKVIWPCMGGDDTVPPADPPEGVSAEEWDALGDPGKRAIIRERTAREKAERDLAASRARPAPPKTGVPTPTPPAPKPEDKPGDQPDIAAIVQQAVAAAIKPFEEREQARQGEEAAEAIRVAVVEAAKDYLHDPTDAPLNVDLAKVVDADGNADPAKITEALDALGKSKPHLVKDGRRFAPPGAGPTPGGVAAPIEDRVKSSLERMQTASGVKVR